MWVNILIRNVYCLKQVNFVADVCVVDFMNHFMIIISLDFFCNYLVANFVMKCLLGSGVIYDDEKIN